MFGQPCSAFSGGIGICCHVKPPVADAGGNQRLCMTDEPEFH
ncbi:hypothetical protein [Polaromonas sp. CG9_12]|nr:hypothetical protein [Polaromonas sp. CG9_12]